MGATKEQRPKINFNLFLGSLTAAIRRYLKPLKVSSRKQWEMQADLPSKYRLGLLLLQHKSLWMSSCPSIKNKHGGMGLVLSTFQTLPFLQFVRLLWNPRPGWKHQWREFQEAEHLKELHTNLACAWEGMCFQGVQVWTIRGQQFQHQIQSCRGKVI